MLFKIFTLIDDLEKRINGNVRISIHVVAQTLVLRCEWLEGGKLIRMNHGLHVMDIMKYKGEEAEILQIFVEKANTSYRKKIEEMIKELKDASKTKEYQDR